LPLSEIQPAIRVRAVRARYPWLLAVLAAAGGARTGATTRPPTPKKVKPLDVVDPVKVEDEYDPERDAVGYDEPPADDPGYAWAAADNLQGTMSEYSLSDELQSHEGALRSCFLDVGVDYMRLDLRVRWTASYSATVMVLHAEPDDPTTALTDCLAGVFETLSLSTGRLDDSMKYPAAADITVERGYGSEGGAVGGMP
jgi:hypothetical protein